MTVTSTCDFCGTVMPTAAPGQVTLRALVKRYGTDTDRAFRADACHECREAFAEADADDLRPFAACLIAIGRRRSTMRAGLYRQIDEKQDTIARLRDEKDAPKAETPTTFHHVATDGAQVLTISTPVIWGNLLVDRNRSATPPLTVEQRLLRVERDAGIVVAYIANHLSLRAMWEEGKRLHEGGAA